MTETPLPREYLPATGSARQELVLLHGWGSSREIWRPLLARLRPWANITLLDLPIAPHLGAAQCGDDTAGMLRAILAAAPPRAVYLGWSLGGQLATLLAARHGDRVAALVTLCSNPRFQAGPDWPGMSPEAFARFAADLDRDAKTGLRRFAGLQVLGAARPRRLLRELPAPVGGETTAGLARGLDWLRTLDTREALQRLRVPQLHLFCAGDALVPPSCVPALADLLDRLPGAGVEVLAADCHAAPLSSPDPVAAAVLAFLSAQGLLAREAATSPPVGKGEVADSFSRAAARYDSVAALQRDVGGSLYARLPNPSLAPRRVLDLGCGTGFFQTRLRQRFPAAEHIGLDIAGGMVNHARARHGGTGWLVADAESLPLASDSVDLVFSSLAIQWCYRPDLLFAELARVLAPGGLCLFSTLGPGTLRELRSAWAAVDEHRHVNSFLPADRLEAAVSALPQLRLQLVAEQFQMRYQSVPELLRELKALGAHNMNSGRPAGLTGRRSLQAMFRAYESWREGEHLPASYDVIFGTLEKR